MRPVRFALSALFLLLAACTGWRHGTESATPAASGPIPQTTGPSTVAPAAAERQAASGAPAVATVAAPAAANTAAPAPEIPIASGGPAKSKRASSPAPVHPPPAVQASGTVPKQAIVSAAAEKPPTAAPLDLAALEQRLKETHAIGVFTKLSLKNQVDDLLDQFRAHYRESGPPPPSGLRERYDLLILKVLSLLQDGDPTLAKSIGSSREAIWGILNDPAKLAAI